MRRVFVADVPRSVCLLDMTMSCAKPAEPIEISFEVWTRALGKGTMTEVGARMSPLPRKKHFGGRAAIRSFVKVL